MIQQFISAITSLLLDKQNATIQCARVIMNFIMPAQYEFHDEITLSYMKQALYQINKLKMMFIKYRSQNITYNEDNENETHFNILKLYIINHYMTFIHLYNSAQSFNMTYDETAHKFLLKIFFLRTNKHKK